MLFVSKGADAQAVVSPPVNAAQASRIMFVDPSSTKVSLGKVNLIVNPLTRKGNLYVGEYEIKVTPYYFKNERGTLELVAPDDSVQKLLGGIPIKFTGKATDNKNSKPKVIIGNVTPSANDRGNVTFTIVTDNGLMVFNTSYHFGE